MPQPFAGQALDRRTILKGLTGAATAAAVGPSRLIAQAAAPEVTTLNARLAVVGGLGGNIVVRSAGDVTVVDSGNAAHTETLIEVIESLSGAGRAETVFNTHWHLDQVGGNARLAAGGAAIIAHEKTHAHLAHPHYLPAEDRYQPAAEAEALPTERFFDEGMIRLDGEIVRYGHLLEAHTDGDIYVKFENDNVIAAGDAISPARDPELDWYGGGWLGGRLDSLELLLALSDDATQFVPGYGPVVDRSYVEAEHELMLGLYDILWERIRAGESAGDIYASGRLDALPRRFDDPMKLLYDAHKSMWAHYNTLSPDIV